MDSTILVENLMHTKLYQIDIYGVPMTEMTSAEQQILDFYLRIFPHEQNIAYFSEHHHPLIQQDILTLFWITIPEYRNQMLVSVYIVGPICNLKHDVAFFLREQISSNVARRLSSLQPVSFNMIYSTAEALYQSVNQESAPVRTVYTEKDNPIREYDWLHYTTTPVVNRNVDFENMLIQGIVRGLSNDAINKLLSPLSTEQFQKDAPVRLYIDYFVGMVHQISNEVASLGGIGNNAFLLYNHFVITAESCRTKEDVDQLWNPMREAYVNLVQEIKGLKKYSKPVRFCINYINNHLNRKITINEIARAIGYHPNYLASLYTRETGKSIHTTIQELRTNRATFFLSYTPFSIADIALSLGYSSISAFSTTFKKYAGHTPNEYRQITQPEERQFFHHDIKE